MNKRSRSTNPPKGKPRITRQTVEEFSKRYRIENPTGEKVLWLSSVLRSLSESSIGADFALMGGSAIAFLYRGMYRFSTDLDLDFIGNKSLGKGGQDEIDRRQGSDEKVFSALADGLGCSIKRLPREHPRYLQFALEYHSFFTRSGVVELDISYRFCHAVLGPVRLSWPISLHGMLPKFKVQTLRQEELYASKALAMVDVKERLDFPGKIGFMGKRKVRHLFDMYYLADDVRKGDAEIDLDHLKQLIVLFGMSRIVNFQYFRGDAIGGYQEADVERELRSVVPRNVPVPTVGEMKWEVRKFLDVHIYNWTRREHRFVEDFAAGIFRPEDLF